MALTEPAPSIWERVICGVIIAMLTGVNTWYREGGRLSRERVEVVYLEMVRNTVGV